MQECTIFHRYRMCIKSDHWHVKWHGKFLYISSPNRNDFAVVYYGIIYIIGLKLLLSTATILIAAVWREKKVPESWKIHSKFRVAPIIKQQNLASLTCFKLPSNCQWVHMSPFKCSACGMWNFHLINLVERWKTKFVEAMVWISMMLFPFMNLLKTKQNKEPNILSRKLINKNSNGWNNTDNNNQWKLKRKRKHEQIKHFNKNT